MRSTPSALVRMIPSGSSTIAAAQRGGEVTDAAQRARVPRACAELSVDDRVGLPGLVAAGVAERVLGGGVPLTAEPGPGHVERYLLDRMKGGPIHFTLIDPDKSPTPTAGAVAKRAVALGSHAVLLG